MNRGWPNSTAWPFSAMTLVMVPALSASISFMIFMASMMHTDWPFLTTLPMSTSGLAAVAATPRGGGDTGVGEDGDAGGPGEADSERDPADPAQEHT